MAECVLFSEQWQRITSDSGVLMSVIMGRLEVFVLFMYSLFLGRRPQMELFIGARTRCEGINGVIESNDRHLAVRARERVTQIPSRAALNSLISRASMLFNFTIK
jgi:hypothetical protein